MLFSNFIASKSADEKSSTILESVNKSLVINPLDSSSCLAKGGALYWDSK